MEEKDYLDLLAKREIQPTAIRILVLQAMLKAGRSVSLLDLEKILDTVDKSSIFRTITLFLSHHLVHSIDDGTGSFKYAVCSAGCSCEVNDLHTHFIVRDATNVLFQQHPHPGSTSAGGIYPQQHQLCAERAMPRMCRKISQERLIILFFHTAFPDLQMSGNNHLLDRFVSPYLFDE